MYSCIDSTHSIHLCMALQSSLDLKLLIQWLNEQTMQTIHSMTNRPASLSLSLIDLPLSLSKREKTLVGYYKDQ